MTARSTALAVLSVATLAAVAASCASAGRLPRASQERLVWPPAPEAARIEFVGSFTGAKDLGIRPGLLGRVVAVVAGDETPAFDRPYAIAVWGDAEGTGVDGGRGPARIAVGDTGAHGVHLLDLEHGRQSLVRDAGEERTLQSPVAVGFDGDARLYVCDSELGLLLRYDADGGFDRVLSRSLARPAGLAIDAAHRVLYVADAAEHVVRTFGLDGEPRGALAEEFRFPAHLALDRGGGLLVSDSMQFRVAVVGADGRLAATAGRHGDASGDLERPKGVATDSEGDLYVADALFDNVQIFDRAGRLLLAFGGAGTGPGEFEMPAGLAIDGRDVVYVADTYNGRIQVFRFLGRGEQ